jgi:hypothetical protein
VYQRVQDEVDLMQTLDPDPTRILARTRGEVEDFNEMSAIGDIRRQS